jgi:phosphotransferase system enzyme I (PtsP)
MIIVHDKRLLNLPANTHLIVDSEQGALFVRPGEDVIRNFEGLKEAKKRAEEIESTIKPETRTSDGTVVRLLANINLLSDLDVAKRLKAEGIGLYRTEFPFVVRNDFPSEEEQYRVYRKLAEAMPGREVVFRTLDVGGDKMLSYFQTGNEANPFLGLRAIRLSLRYRNIFAPQIRALLRAGAGGEMRIMFPFVSSVDDFIEARDFVRECITQLAQENVPHNGNPLFGIMVELPAAVEIIEELAYEVDFMSIGSNDLVQYILAVDRTNEQIADLYMPHHPAVLRSLKKIVDAAEKFSKHLSICGDIAASRTMLPFLLGIGIRNLSVDIRRLIQVQQIVSSIDITQARANATAMLQCSRISQIKALLESEGTKT